MCGGKPRERSKCGAVVFGRICQFVVHVLRAQWHDASLAEADPLGDEHTVAADWIEAGEIGPGHSDWKGRMARERCQAHFAIHLMRAPITEGIP